MARASAGECEHKKKADDLACGPDKVCQAGQCVLNKGCAGKQDGASCDDADACTANDACVKGKCAGGATKACDDGDACTKDVCDAISGKCSSKAGDDGAPCEDGNVCTVGDSCKAGKCGPGAKKSCDDGNACTADSCDQLKGCVAVATAAGSPCDDANKCTEGDFCQDKACKPGKYTCPGVCGDNQCSEGENCGICAQDCGICLGDAEVTFTLAPKSPGLLAGTSVDRKESRYDQTLEALHSEPAGKSGTVTAASGPLTGDASYSTRKNPAASVTGIVRTTDTWQDQPTVRAVAQVRDKDGRSQVAPGVVKLRLKKPGHADVVGSCAPNGAGICELAANVPPGWFETGKDSAATAQLETGGLQPTTPSTVKLHAVPLFAASPANGVALTLPLGPRLPGTTFVVPIFAYTSGQPLESFDIAVKYNGAVVDILAVNPSAQYDAQRNVKSAEVLLVGVRKNGVADPKVTGKVLLANVTMRVRAGVTPGSAGAISGVVKGMFNVQNVPLAPQGSAIKIRGPKGTGESADVTAAANPVRGIYAWTDVPEAFNTAALDGNAIKYKVHARAARTVGPDATPSTSCTSPDKGVFSTDSACNWTLTGSETKGSTGAVNVSAEGLSVSVPVRTWHPQTVTLKAKDATLSPVTGWAKDCSAPSKLRYQRSDVIAEATFKSSGAERTVRVDRWVTLSSTDSAVVSVNKPNGSEKAEIAGQKPGSAFIRALRGGKELAKVAVTVDTKAVSVQDLAVVVANELAASVAPPPSSAMDVAKPGKVAGLLSQKLFAEFQTAEVLTWAKLSDGQRMWVDMAAGVTVTTLDDGVIEPVLGKLQVRAVGSGKGKLARADWKICDKVIGSGLGEVLVKLPPPKSASATVQQGRIAKSASDPAAAAGIPSSSGVTVKLSYADGTSKDVTLDKRTVYDADSLDPNDLFTVQVQKGKDGVPSKVTILPTGKGTGGATLRVTFKHAPGITATAKVHIVAHAKFTLDAHPLPTYPGSDQVSQTTLHKLANTGVWQRARLDLRSVLSDGHVIDVSTHAKTVFSAFLQGTDKPDTATFTISGRDLAVQKAGKSDLVGTFAGAKSSPLLMTAIDQPLPVTSLQTSFPATFSGIQDKGAAQMKVSATFKDKTTITDALSIKGLLSFSSDKPKVASIHAVTGLAMIHDNDREPVTLTAKAVMSGVTGASKTSANLLADIGDVDLGRTSGVAHPDVKPGETFTMPVRVNTGTQPLGAMDLTVTYDPDVIAAISGKAGKQWPGGQLEVTVNDPPGKVHIVAAAKVGTKAKGAALEVAVLMFKGVKKGAKTITVVGGHVTKLLDNNKPQQPIGAELKPGQTRSIVAGRGELDPECANGKKPEDFRGNTNGNCEFEVGDVSFTLQYLAQLVTDAELEPWQKKELDADRNGVIEVRDAVYLLRVLAGKFRFADVAVDSPGTLKGTLTLQAKLTDKGGNPSQAQNDVFFEVGWLLNDQLTWGTGKVVAASKATKHGVVVQAVHSGGGVYIAKATGFTKEEKDVGVALVVKTTDASGNTSSDRQIALHGSPWLSDLAKYAPIAVFDMPRQICKAAYQCDDKNLCTIEICNEVTEKCSYKPTNCDDANACTLDSCDPDKGCTYKVTPNTDQPCYTGPKGTKDIGTCKGGKVTCNADGSAGPCQGEVKPAYKEQCDAKDDDCDGQTDEGCAPKGFDGGFGSGVLEGQAGTRQAHGSLASSWTAGEVQGGKYQVEIGLYEWLNSYFGQLK